MLSVARRKLRLEASLRALEAAADAAKKQGKSGATRTANLDTTKRIEAMHRLLAETQVPSRPYACNASVVTFGYHQQGVLHLRFDCSPT